jgi:hypothetical protein
MRVRTPKALRKAFARAGRRREAQFRRREGRLVLPTWIMATATLTVAGIAIYGAFFTSIPDAIIRQLQNEADATREELIAVRRQRNSAEELLDIFSSRIEEARVELKELEKQRNVYVRELWELATRDLIQAMRREVREIEIFDHPIVTSYVAAVEWRPKEVEYMGAMLEMFNRWSEASTQVDRNMIYSEMGFASRIFNNERPLLRYWDMDTNFPTNPRPPMNPFSLQPGENYFYLVDKGHADDLFSFIAEVENSRHAKGVGSTITLRERLLDRAGRGVSTRLADKEREHFSLLILEFLNARPSKVSDTLGYRLRIGATPEQLREHIIMVEAQLKDHQKVFLELETYLLERAPVPKASSE